jgi:hypothetical protein
MISAQSASIIQEAFMLFPAIVATFTARGFSRAFAAKKRGDYTAAHLGLATLNPAAHVDILAILLFVTSIAFFNLMIPIKGITNILILVLIIFGPRWSVQTPINPANLKNPSKDLAFIAMSGFLGTIFCSLLASYLARASFLFISSPIVASALAGIAYSILDISIMFNVFFMLPIVPLEGSAVWAYLFPKTERFLALLADHPIITIAIIFALQGVIFVLPFLLLKTLILKLTFI